MNITPAKYASAFKWLRGTCTGLGVATPAFSFFTHYAPPLFEAASLLTAAIAGAVILLTYYYEPRVVAPDTKAKKLVRSARTVLIIAVSLLIVYMILLSICTVAEPPLKPSTRYQTGVWTFGWSLNEDGKYLMEEHPGATPRELLDYAAAFAPEGPAKIWKIWSILVSGLSMILIFLVAFVLWVFGWALLAKRKLLDEA